MCRRRGSQRNRTQLSPCPPQTSLNQRVRFRDGIRQWHKKIRENKESKGLQETIDSTKKDTGRHQFLSVSILVSTVEIYSSSDLQNRQ